MEHWLVSFKTNRGVMLDWTKDGWSMRSGTTQSHGGFQYVQIWERLFTSEPEALSGYITARTHPDATEVRLLKASWNQVLPA